MSSIPCIDLVTPVVPRSAAHSIQDVRLRPFEKKMTNVSCHDLATPLIPRGHARRSEVVKSLKEIGNAMGMNSHSEKEILNAALKFVQESKKNEKKEHHDIELMTSELDAVNARIKELETQLAASNSTVPQAEELPSQAIEHAAFPEPMNVHVYSSDCDVAINARNFYNYVDDSVIVNEYGNLFLWHIPDCHPNGHVDRQVELKVEEEDDEKTRILKEQRENAITIN